MARRRMVDPNIWQSEDFAGLSLLAKLVFIGMFSNADDAGRGRAKAVYLRSILFPYEEGLRVADIEKALLEIRTRMSVTLYEVDGGEYYRFDHWRKWQRVDKPQPSMIPEPVEASPENDVAVRSGNQSGTSPESFQNGSGAKEEKGRQGKEKGKEAISCSAGTAAGLGGDMLGDGPGFLQSKKGQLVAPPAAPQGPGFLQSKKGQLLAPPAAPGIGPDDKKISIREGPGCSQREQAEFIPPPAAPGTEPDSNKRVIREGPGFSRSEKVELVQPPAAPGTEPDSNKRVIKEGATLAEILDGVD